MRTIIGHAAYNFRDKDPDCYTLKSALEKKYGRPIVRKDLNRTRYMGGPLAVTSYNIIFGDTFKPRNSSLNSIAEANGLTRGGWVEDESVVPSERVLTRWRKKAGVPTPRELSARGTAILKGTVPKKRKKRTGKAH